MLLKVIAVSIISLFIISCTPLITYNLDDTKNTNLNYEKIIRNYKLSKLTLSVQPFQDYRKSNSYMKEEIFNNENKSKSKTECYNWEYRYGKLIISDTISELLANHFDSMEIFKKVYFNEKEQADLYMTCNLISFAAHTNVNKDAKKAAVVQVAGASFGLIGAVVATAAAGHIEQSYYDYEMKYANVVVYDKKGKIVYQLPEFISNGRRQIPPVSSCDNLNFFIFVNEELKWHNDLFIEKISDELSKVLNSPI